MDRGCQGFTALFTVLEPWLTRPGEWQPIRVILAPSPCGVGARDPADGPEGHDVGTGGREGQEPPRIQAAPALLWVDLGDLHEGYVGIGFGTTSERIRKAPTPLIQPAEVGVQPGKAATGPGAT